VQVQPDGLLKVLTRRGKQRNVAASDPRLRPARWWETLFFRRRFPQATDSSGASSSPRAA